MKVPNIITGCSPKWGGPSPVVKGLTERLARKGVKVTIFALVKQGAQDEGVRLERVEVRLFKQYFLSHIWTSHSFGLTRVHDPRNL